MVEIPGGFGVYVHWPFCLSKCPYCDFNSHVAATVDGRVWAHAYVDELLRAHGETPGRRVETLFFGGGTPSLMPPEIVETVIAVIADNWGFARGAEITVEANPTSVEAARLSDFRNAGVNRVSLGIQSLDDRDLRRLGRRHSADEALRALDVAQQVFRRVSFDLIYARQFQSIQSWEHELSRALMLGTEHLSLYQLTIEDGTAFGRQHHAGRLGGLPADDVAADMYEMTQDMCRTAGMPGYEVSNHARPGAQSRHNLIYWRGGDYVGIGPGAHGRLTLGAHRFATVATRAPDAWLTQAASGGAECERVALSGRERLVEYVMMALRLDEGLDRLRMDAILPAVDLAPVFAELIADGFLAQTDAGVRATRRGRLLLNALTARIVNAIAV